MFPNFLLRSKAMRSLWSLFLGKPHLPKACCRMKEAVLGRDGQLLQAS